MEKASFEGPENLDCCLQRKIGNDITNWRDITEVVNWEPSLWIISRSLLKTRILNFLTLQRKRSKTGRKGMLYSSSLQCCKRRGFLFSALRVASKNWHSRNWSSLRSHWPV